MKHQKCDVAFHVGETYEIVKKLLDESLVAKLTTDNAKLRAALEPMLRYCQLSEMDGGDFDEMVEQAAAALAQEDSDDTQKAE